MSSAQTRIADTIEQFYIAADRSSPGALAANAYKRAVEDLDHSITRELARAFPTLSPRGCFLTTNRFLGRAIPDNDYGTRRQTVRTLPYGNRTHQQTKQEGEQPPAPAAVISP